MRKLTDIFKGKNTQTHKLATALANPALVGIGRKKAKEEADARSGKIFTSQPLLTGGDEKPYEGEMKPGYRSFGGDRVSSTHKKDHELKGKRWTVPPTGGYRKKELGGGHKLLSSKGEDRLRRLKLNTQGRKETDIFGKSINKGLTSRSFPLVGTPNRTIYNGSTQENATRVPTNSPFNATEISQQSLFPQDTYKSAHGCMYKSNRVGGCPRCEIAKSTICKSCGGDKVKSISKGLHCPSCN
jgi:hypothetical protein